MRIWYKELRANKERKDKFESEWAEGLWLGHSRSSNEHVVGTKSGVVRAYSIKRQDAEARWSAELVKSMQGTPQQPDPGKPGLAIPIRVNFDPPAVAEPVPVSPESKPRQIRRMKLTGRILEKYGYSENCEGCRYRQAGLGESRNHSECRRRIEEAMKEDEEGRQERNEQEERINRRIAERMEEADQARVEEEARGHSDQAAHDPDLDLEGPGAESRGDGLEPDDPSVPAHGEAEAEEEPIARHEAANAGGSCAPAARGRSRSRSPKRQSLDEESDRARTPSQEEASC